MDPQKLQHFLAVYECGNFRRAAESVNVTQQAVSKAIARLEDQLGLQLFERTSIGARPTNYAHVLARHAKIILAEINLASAELMAMRGSTGGFLQVGIGWSVAPRIGPIAVEQFRELRPGVGLRIVTSGSAELFTQLLQGELDFVVSAPPRELPVDQGLDISQKLYLENDRVIVRKQHPLAAKNEITLNDLSKYTWLMELSSPERWHAICEEFVRKGVAPPREVIDVNSLSMAKAMLLNADYLCLFSEEICAIELGLDLLEVLQPDLLPMNRSAVLATRKGVELQPAATVLKSILLKVCNQFYPNEQSLDITS